MAHSNTQHRIERFDGPGGSVGETSCHALDADGRLVAVGASASRLATTRCSKTAI